MSVHIKEINVQDLGPIERFSMKPGIFNLIYGRNEKGKTFLVEFIIRSLFRNTKLWTLRDIKGTGKIRTRGLEPKLVDFFPSSPEKVDDYWETDSGLPQDFSKLLVVKGAEAELSERKGGIDKAILKQYLSSQGVLDSIDRNENISPTIKTAELRQGSVIGKRQGELKRKEELNERLEILDGLFQRIDSEFSRGNLKTLTDKKEAILKQITQLDKAKRHQAYNIHQEKKQLERQLKNYDEKKIQDIERDIGIYKKSTVPKLKKKSQELETARKSSEHYEWLKQAKDTYEKLLEFKPSKFLPICGILVIILIVLAVLFAILDMRISTLVSLSGILIFGIFFLVKLHANISLKPKIEQQKSIEAEFERKFGEKLTDLPKIQTFLVQKQDDYNNIKIYSKDHEELIKEKNNLESSIEDNFFNLTGEKVTTSQWTEKLSAVKDIIKDLKDQLEEKKTQLIQLDVDPSDFEPEPQDIPYSQKRYDELQEDISSLDEQIKQEDQQLEHLKRDIYQETRDKQAGDWDSLINNLRERREKTLKDYKELTAEIVGKVITHETVEELRKGEDEKINEGLQSEEVRVHMKNFTNRYEQMTLKNDELIVSDPYSKFSLSRISTGAQEQILLALRIGFAQKLTKQDEPLFLILDDAFQYSDWERREWLMDAIVELAKSGWQIIYFTMDDHIRDLFQERGKKNFGSDYKYQPLE